MNIVQKPLFSGTTLGAKSLGTKPILGGKATDIYFNPNIKSVDIPEEFFTNYIDSRKSLIVKTIKNERRRILTKEVDYNREYEVKDIINKSNEYKKIDKILKKTVGAVSINYNFLWRMKYISNPELQFFFYEKLNGTFEILIIDIYHLIVTAADRDHGEIVANPKKKYKEHHKDNPEKTMYNLSEIFKVTY